MSCADVAQSHRARAQCAGASAWAVLARWSGEGRLAPAWRWALADAAIYPKRGTTAQYRESDLDFLRRLLAEEGLFCWFEHAADDGEAFGRHTLVIADHNGAFTDNVQPRQRFTQPGSSMREDSLDRREGAAPTRYHRARRRQLGLPQPLRP